MNLFIFYCPELAHAIDTVETTDLYNCSYKYFVKDQGDKHDKTDIKLTFDNAYSKMLEIQP